MLKKLLTLLVVCSSGICLAQTESSNWSFGPKVGVTVAGVNRSAIRSFAGITLNEITTQTRKSTQFGLMINHQFSPAFSIQPEILYNRYGGTVGGSYTFAGRSSRADVGLTISTVEVPVLLKLTVGQGRVRGFINGGGFVAYTVGNQINTDTALLKSLIPDLNGKFLYGAVGGLGLSIALGPGQVLLEGRYSYTLDDTIDLDFGGGRLNYQLGSGSIGYLISF